MNKDLVEPVHNAPTEQGRLLLKKALNLTSNILIGIMGVLIVGMLFVLFTSVRAGGPPTILNHQLFIVRSNSMSPTFNTGSLILVREIDPSLIRDNDIITYQRGGAISVTHRVVGVVEEGGLQFITRGDANNVNDPMPVFPQELIGKVSRVVPLVGFGLGFARTRAGFVVLLVVPGLLIIGTQALSIFKQLKDEKSKDKSELDQSAD